MKTLAMPDGVVAVTHEPSPAAPVITISQKRSRSFMGAPRYSAWIQFADGTHANDDDWDLAALTARVEAKYGVKVSG